MPIYRDKNMTWRVGISGAKGPHSMNGKTLAEAVGEGWGNKLMDVGCTNEQYAAIDAEMERQRWYMNWCYRCQTSTYHTNNKGCLDCANGPAPSLADILGPAWSVEAVMARTEAGK